MAKKLIKESKEDKRVSPFFMQASSRRNIAADIIQSDRFANIENGISPFTYNVNGNVQIQEPIILCQKAYYNISIFRNTIDLMTEFSCAPLYWKGGTAKSRDFFKAFCVKVGMPNVQDQFFREMYRSSNIPIYRIDAELQMTDINNLTKVYGSSSKGSVSLPIRYTILNPADLQLGGALNFTNAIFFKVLSNYEVAQLRNPKTEEDKQVFNSLPPETQRLIKSGAAQVLIPLNPDKLSAVFYKKQDYEPFSVPMGYPVLEDINWKEEMKKMDKAITRTMQQAILLITMGAPPDDGGINYKLLEQMQELFKNESIGRVLIADYTTKASFILPDIANLIDPKKYAQVDRDIKEGLNAIILGGSTSDGEKFANQSIKVSIFIERLRQAREKFILDFLSPEVRRISETLGFKSYPTPFFEEFDLKDEVEMARIYTRLVEIGLLTPDEGISALETGVLPSVEDSLESQAKFRKLKDAGLYQPITGGAYDALELAKYNAQQAAQLPASNGRPSGIKTKKTTTKRKPVGGNFSLKKLTENIIVAQKVENTIEELFKKKNKIKSLNEKQKEIVENVTYIIVANEEPDKWIESSEKYFSNPIHTNLSRLEEIEQISIEHQVSDIMAAMLFASKK